MYIPDNYDAWKAHDAEQQRLLEKSFKLAFMDEDEMLNEIKDSVSELLDFITEKLAKKGGE